MTKSMDFNALGDKHKKIESLGTSLRFPSVGVLMARLDGNAFHTYTRFMKRPYDENFAKAMVYTTRRLVERFNCSAAYVQSDEITLIWDKTEPTSPDDIFPFDGKAQKLNSIQSILCRYLTVEFGLCPIVTLPWKTSCGVNGMLRKTQ